MSETLLTPNADIEPNFFLAYVLLLTSTDVKKLSFAGTLSLDGLGHGGSRAGKRNWTV